MAYEVTANRRRPTCFENLVGQEFVAETLKNSIQANKIAHAYLFSGPRGCGKTSTARILAKALNCEKGPTASPCGVCSACKEITLGSALDVIEIDGASNTSVNDVRSIKDEVVFPPNSCRYKIYIIDEVHMLSTSAFNALLKTIEEPPPYCVFIFATTELQKVPATIKSRCQQFNFRLVPTEKIKEQLFLASQELGIKAEDEALFWIAKEGTGSMRDSYTLFDQVASFSGNEITFEKIRDKLGLVGNDKLNELFSLCIKKDTGVTLKKLDELIQSGISIEQLISNCTEYLRSLLLIKNGVKKESLLGQSAERFSQEVTDAWSSVQLERALSIFLQLYRDIRYSLNPRYELELSFSRLSWLSDFVSVSEVKKLAEELKPLLKGSSSKENSSNEAQKETEKKIDNQNIPRFSFLNVSSQDKRDANDPSPEDKEKLFEKQSDKKSEENPSQKDADTSKVVLSVGIEDAIKNMIETFKNEAPMLANALSKIKDWKLENEKVSATSQSQFDTAQIQGNKSKIVDYLSKTLQIPVKFEVLFSEEKPSEEDNKIPSEVEILQGTFRGALV